MGLSKGVCLAGQPFQRHDAAAAGMTNWLHALDVDFFVLMHKFPIRSNSSTEIVIRQKSSTYVHVCMLMKFVPSTTYQFPAHKGFVEYR